MIWDFSPNILIQGINQADAMVYLQQNQIYQPDITLLGVVDGYNDLQFDNITIFDLVLSAVKAQPSITTSLIFNQPHHVLDGCYEAIEAGIKQIVIYTPQIVPLDLIKIYQKAKNKGVEILGSSQAGILKPERYNCGVKNPQKFTRGNIGIINFTDETVTQEISTLLTQGKLGISTLINLGNRYFTEINWDLWLKTLIEDEQTKSILIIINQITPLDADNLTIALAKVTQKPITIYLLDMDNWSNKINYHHPKVISDQIINYLYPISALELIQECNSQDNITITNKLYELQQIDH